MVDITNLVNTYSVTKGAYEDIFKTQGFKPVEEETAKEVEEPEEKENKPVEPKKRGRKPKAEDEDEADEEPKAEDEDEDEDEDEADEEAYIEELMEKPISQWNKEEVKTYASLKNVDISNTKNIGEARNIIKQSIDKE